MVYNGGGNGSDDAALSSGKLCKYFFTQMSVTILFLVVFEAESTVAEFELIETFLIYQCVLLVIELLFFLFRTSRPPFPSDSSEALSDRYHRMTRFDLSISLISLLLYILQICWLVYGNYIYFNMPADLPH